MAKATKKQALGRGLSALLNDPKNDISKVTDKNADQLVGNVIELDLNCISVNPNQPRTHFDQAAIEELASSITELGIIQPITVRKLKFNSYELVSGERRFRASKHAGLTTIPAYVRIANDQESLEMALVENIQRQDLDPIEIAQSYQRLIEEVKLTQEEMSKRVGKKRSTISNYLRLLNLDPLVQTGIRDGFISMGHGKAIINFEDSEQQIELYNKIVSKKLSVRETEREVQRIKAGGSVKLPKKELPQEVKELSKALEAQLNSKVKISYASGKGKIEIGFKSEEELNQIKKSILGE
jgi:ParB family chromosome partitioning protein